jgi:hypothetical protein
MPIRNRRPSAGGAPAGAPQATPRRICGTSASPPARARARVPLSPIPRWTSARTWDRARARPASTRARRLILLPRCRPASPRPPLPGWHRVFRPAPQLLRYPPSGGDPTRNERPESFPAERPINDRVAGPTAEHPDRPGHPRSDRTHPVSEPLAAELQRGPGSDKRKWT